MALSPVENEQGADSSASFSKRTLSTSAQAFRQQVRGHLSGKSPNEKALNFDLIVIGGGITGAGILREAARRGLKVLLLEQKDFAWGTSSRSSKMVHGGLRYLGEGQFRLTRESVKERQRYLDEAPGLVDVMRYLMVHKPGQFPPRWLFQILLSIYDFFAGKKYRQSVDASDLPGWLGPIAAGDATGGSVFADAVTDDSRLVFRALTEAINDCGVALNYCAVTSLDKNAEGRVTGVTVQDDVLGESYSLTASAVVNATGAWATELAKENAPQLRPLRGSHLVVPFWRLPVSCSISMLHPKDKRPVFVFPWQGASVIGTTDLDHTAPLNEEASISQEEVDYLLEGANYYLSSSALTEADVVSTWAGVRPVISSGKGLDPSKENREHTIWQQPGLITVSGGKLTTFRVIAFDVLEKVLKDELGRNNSTRVRDFGQAFFTSTQYAAQRLGRLTGRFKRRLSGRYGIRAFELTETHSQGVEIESSVGYSDTSWAELEWAIKNESVVHLDDLMLRRTRLGNVLPNLSDAYWDRIKALFIEHQQWSQQQWEQELERYQGIWQRCYSMPCRRLEVPHQTTCDVKKEAV
ncbi:glycerol-3-phosphate dehydrogenase/oxidase [Litoribrevibacter albus]|uniref:FAD-dependent glycerol-3-phosphate dehydrogenase n=1 Tax=Litoribrevibacter albus TaxID=1473156 RepID=A0AA37SB44_9GAMM|nr:glycerol-3-phosphate dehydrogenase/oxidase [Litoribrevibacter albus]GLQ31921.1 FAD-dependent glycerol-3-phosphate dehydrogenase [Litoribrevibacter albus]